MPKIIKLNENDLRNIVNRVISESNKHDVKWTKNFKKFFKPNEYELEDRDQRELLELIDDIRRELDRYEDGIVTIKLKGGESKTPNIVSVRGEEQKHPPGAMAKRRCHWTKKFLQNHGGDLLRGVNYVTDKPFINGPDYDPSKRMNHPEYMDNQFVDLLVTVNGNVRR